MAKTPEQVYQAKIDSAVASGQLTAAQGASLSAMLSENANARGQLGPNLREDLNANFRLYSSQNSGSGGGGDVNDGGGSGPGNDGNGTNQIPPKPNVPGMDFYWSGQEWVGVPIDGYESPSDKAARERQEKEDRQTAEQYLTDLLTDFGLEALIPTVSGLIKEWGNNNTIIASRLRGTEAYKERFRGNEMRVKAGLNALNEAEYLRLEDQFRGTMSNLGLPTTYYDSPSDYARLIGANLSVDEVQERVIAAKQAMNPLVAAELREYYNITDGDLTAYMLGLTDEKGLLLAGTTAARNQEQVRQAARLSQIGAAAERAGFSMTKAQSESLAGTSIGQTIDPFQMETMSRLEGTFDQARRVADRETTLAGIDNEAFDQRDALAAAFGDQQKALASERRAKRERSRFSGSSGASAASLSVQRNL